MKPKYITAILLGLAASSTSYADVLIDFGQANQILAVESEFESAVGSIPTGTASGTIYEVSGPAPSARIGASYSILNFYDRGTTNLNGVNSFNSGLTINNLENDYIFLTTGGDPAITVEICNLAAILSPSTEYTIYLWGQGDQPNQGSAFVFDVNNISDPTAGLELKTADDPDLAAPPVVSYTFTTPATLPDSLKFDWYRAVEGPASTAGYAGMPALAITGPTVETTFSPGALTDFTVNGFEVNSAACEFPALGTQIPSFEATFAGLPCSIPVAANDFDITYSSGDESVATVDFDGFVTPTGLGTTTITANYQGLTASIPVTVTQAFPPAPVVVHRYSFNNADASTDTSLANGGAIEPDLVGSADGIVYDATYDGNGQLIFNNTATVPGTDPAELLCPHVDLPNGIFSGFAKNAAGTEGQSFSIEWWASASRTGGSWQRFFAFGRSTATGTTPGLEVGESDVNCNTDTGNGADFFDIVAKRSNAGQTRIEVNDTTGGSTVFFDQIAFPSNEMIHWVMTYDLDCNVISLYQDGKIWQTTGGISGENLATISDVNNYIGRPSWSGNALFGGSFDEVRFFTGVMDELDIAQSYAAGPDAPNEDLLVDPGNLVSLASTPNPLVLSKASPDEDYQLKIDATFDGGSTFEVTNFSAVTYSSDDIDVIEFDEDGQIVYTAPGTANITVTYAHSSGTQSVVVPVTIEDITAVTVAAPTTTIGFDGEAKPNVQFTASADFGSLTGLDVTNALDIDWTSSDETVATVDFATGLVTPVAAGTATISAEYCGMSDGVEITVAEFAAKPPIQKHHYTFNYPDGSTPTTVPDSVGGMDGVVVNSGFSYSGGALNLPGGAVAAGDTTAPFVDLPNGMISGLDTTTYGNAHSFEMWVTRTSTSNWERLFSFGSSSGGEGFSGTGLTYLYLTAQKGGTGAPGSSFTTNSSGGETMKLEDTLPMPTTETHFVVTYDTDNGIGKLYVDGFLVDFDFPTEALSTLDDFNNWLGRAQWNDPLPTLSINEFNVYCGIFSDADASAAYAAGPDITTVLEAPAELNLSVVDYSGGNLNVSAEGLTGGADYQFESYNTTTSSWETVAGSTFTAAGAVEARSIPTAPLGTTALVRLTEATPAP
ncbi:LamG-like jellyroll fold domain-containing protein [Roseibacillus persicicus]|uniref:LamG-like jellyroll fold domain-containing protein n=1 Tax=Roseibacillus persicicus TaxID=454148 RepID=UPI00398BB1FF